MVAGIRRALTASFLLMACAALPACASPQVPAPERPTPASRAATVAPVPPRAVEATLSVKDRRAVLALAREELARERATCFEDVRQAPVSKAEAKRAVLGDIVVGHFIVPSELATAPSLFSAVHQEKLDFVVLPVMLGSRCLATFGFQKSSAGWDESTTGCESPSSDRASVQVDQALAAALGGSPDETRAVGVTGSEWVIARRGNREAAGYVARFAYGSLGDTSVQLPPEGTAVSSGEFRRLLKSMKATH